MSRLKRAFVVVGAGLLVWAAFTLLPNDEKKIRKNLANLVRTVSIAPDDGNIDLLIKSERLISFFTDEMVIEVEGWPREVHAINGKVDLSQRFLSLRGIAQVNRMEVRFADLLVKIAPDQQSATVFTSALVRLNDAKDPFAQELKFTYQKVRGQWLISHIQAIQTLQ